MPRGRVSLAPRPQPAARAADVAMQSAEPDAPDFSSSAARPVAEVAPTRRPRTGSSGSRAGMLGLTFDRVEEWENDPLWTSRGAEDEESKESADEVAAAVPNLTTPGVVCSPSLDSMRAMSDRALASVENFALSHPDSGSVMWHGHTDVRGLDLDSLVRFAHREVEVVVQTDHPLNKPACITLENIFVPNGKDCQQFCDKVERMTTKAGNKLVDYAPATGRWSFDVLGFV